jgi:hypothetical protein
MRHHGSDMETAIQFVRTDLTEEQRQEIGLDSWRRSTMRKLHGMLIANTSSTTDLISAK